LSAGQRHQGEALLLDLAISPDIGLVHQQLSWSRSASGVHVREAVRNALMRQPKGRARVLDQHVASVNCTCPARTAFTSQPASTMPASYCSSMLYS